MMSDGKDIEARIAAINIAAPDHGRGEAIALCRELAADNERLDRELLDVTAAAKFNEHTVKRLEADNNNSAQTPEPQPRYLTGGGKDCPKCGERIEAIFVTCPECRQFIGGEPQPDKKLVRFERELDAVADDFTLKDRQVIAKVCDIARREHAARVKAEQDYKDALDAWEAEIKLRQELEEKVKFLRKRIANEFLRGGKLLERAEKAEAERDAAIAACNELADELKDYKDFFAWCAADKYNKKDIDQLRWYFDRRKKENE